MCNLNILLSKKINPNINLKGFIQSVTSHSFIYNGDGEGFFMDYNDRLIKSKNKIDYTQIKDFNKSKTIITHQRLSTSGHEVKFNHPFMNKDFVIVHNGVINQFKKEEGSDTYGFFLEFIKSFNQSKLKDRDSKIKTVIKDLFKDDLGFYSIFIYDRITKKSYYFKDNTTNINIYSSKNYLFITTSDNNKKFLTMLKENFKQVLIKPRIIYKIENNIVFKSVELLKSKYSLLSEQDPTIKEDTTQQKDTEEDKKKIKDDLLKDYFCYENNSDDIINCYFCNRLIEDSVYLIKDKLCCELCLNRYLEEKELMKISPQMKQTTNKYIFDEL